MDARLVVVEGKASRRVVQLKLPTIIGRSREADVKVGHASVSRIHCEIYELDGALVVRDAGSLNGTFIDSVRITESVLKPGDRLTVGPLTFVAEYEHDGDFPVLPVRPLPSASTTVPDEALKRIASASASSTSPGLSLPPIPVPVNVPASVSVPEPQPSAGAAPPPEVAPVGASPESIAGDAASAPAQAASSPPSEASAVAGAGEPAGMDLPPTLDMPGGYAPVEPPTPDLPAVQDRPAFFQSAAEGGVPQVDEDDDDLQNFFQELGLK